MVKYGYKNITLKSLESNVKNYSKCDPETQIKIKEFLKEMGKNGEKKIGVKVMIFFPNLYKDELLFSVLARFYQYSGDENKKHFMFDLFDSSTTCASTIFPANLEKLCENLPFSNAYSSDYFINNHTLLPYYSPFMTNDRENKLRLIMKNEDGTNIFMSSGRTASRVKNEKK